MARPTDDPKTERIDARFSRSLMRDLDEWRRIQPDIPSRSDAFRRLVQRGLEFDQLASSFDFLSICLVSQIERTKVSVAETENLVSALTRGYDAIKKVKIEYANSFAGIGFQSSVNGLVNIIRLAKVEDEIQGDNLHAFQFSRISKDKK